MVDGTVDVLGEQDTLAVYQVSLTLRVQHVFS